LQNNVSLKGGKMSEGIIIALISFVGAILGALITGFMTIIASGIKGKNENGNSVSCAVLGLIASIGAVGGLVLGALFGVFLVQQSLIKNSPAPQTNYQQPTQDSPNSVAPTTNSQEVDNSQFDNWVICWHGRDGYEYLIAYPQSQAEQGINLNFNLTNAQGHQVEVANDSLKMCYVNGEWYGYPDPNEWFPSVSYFQLSGNEILVCSDSPGCKGNQWTILPEKYYPWNAPELESPKESGVHIIAYKSSK
jgi:hypothetical protein